jgi:hypothetical protein
VVGRLQGASGVEPCRRCLSADGHCAMVDTKTAVIDLNEDGISTCLPMNDEPLNG